MAENFNWGIIGLGRIAHSFAKAVEIVDKTKVFAVASRSLSKAQDFANKYNAPYYYGSYEEIIQNKEIDAVYIATPHALHCENAIMCLENKIPVLCEKPFAMNSKEVKKMINSAKKHNTFLMEAIWTRFVPSLLKVEEIIQSGIIGKPTLLRSDFCFKANFDPLNRIFNKELGGGAILDIGIYPLFLSLLLFGKPHKVNSIASIGKTGIDESCGITLQYKDGEIASLTCSINVDSAKEAEIYGEKGRIKMKGTWFIPTNLTLFQNKGSVEDINFTYKGNGYEYEIIEVMNCLKENKKESNLLRLDFSLELIELMDKIRRENNITYSADL